LNASPLAAAWLTASTWWLDVALGALFLRMIGDLTGGRWAAFADDALRNCAALLLPATIAFAPLLAGVEALSSAAAGTSVPATWAQPGFIVVRTVAVFAIWLLLARAMGAWHDARERRPRVATAGLLLFVPAVTVFHVDWSMLPEAPWYSPAAGVVAIAGQAASGLALALILLWFRHGEDAAGRAERRDLGNLLLVAVLSWAYLAFMEYLIVWIGDLPHETLWYRRRSDTAGVAAALVTLKLVLPFLMLMSRPVRRSGLLLALAAASVLAGHGCEVWWRHRGSVDGEFGLDALALIAVTGACIAFMAWRSGPGPVQGRAS